MSHIIALFGRSIIPPWLKTLSTGALEAGIANVRRTAGISLSYVHISIRDDHGNGVPNGNGNPMGFPWEWELVTKLGMGMGRNGKQPVWEWEWPLFPWESIPIGGYSVKLM